MADKEDSLFNLPDEVGNTFDKQHDILNFRPEINFIEPELQPLEDLEIEEEEEIDNLRNRTDNLIKSYNAVALLGEQAQQRIDNRVKAAGSFTAKLDPVVDAHVIAAIKRHLPDKKDPTEITYEDYRHCLENMKQNAPVAPGITAQDIRDAKNNPTTTDLGGYGNQGGQNRPEVSSSASSVKPLDLSAFQAAAVVALFALLLPMVKTEDKAEVTLHLSTTPHT